MNSPPRDKMVAISQTIISDAFSYLFVSFCILIKISLKIVLKGQIVNNSALVQIMS